MCAASGKKKKVTNKNKYNSDDTGEKSNSKDN